MKRTRIWITLVLGLALALAVALTAFAQPPAPHDEEEDGVSYEDCVYCHRTGQDDAPLLAADHALHQNEDCRVCHATTGMVDAPGVSHPTANWDDCRGCHDRASDVVDVEIPNLADSDYDHDIYESGTCASCHPLATRYYDDVPSVSCGVCHPESAAAETLHNGTEHWVDCVDCHQAAGNYPHDPERIHSQDEDCISCHNEKQGHWDSDTPDERYSLTGHIAEGDPHARTDCSACHLQTATVERNPATSRVQAVLPETEEGVPPDSPELAVVDKDVDCQRCHVSNNAVLAPAAELPPRSILCLACHDGSLVVRDGLSWAGIGIFGVGMLAMASIWLKGSVGGQQGLLLPARLWRIFCAFLDLITTPRLFVLIWSFIMDGLLHRELFRRDKLRWLTHALMFLGMGARMGMGLFTWLMTLLAPTASLTQILADKSSPAIALIYDLLGLLVIVGAFLAVRRRYIKKDDQLISGTQDRIALGLLGAIFALGFVTEGVRILTTGLAFDLAVFSPVGYLVSLVLGLIPANWGVVYGGLWYVHAGLVAALVAYLPFGKFIHVLISPIVAAFNSALEARVA